MKRVLIIGFLYPLTRSGGSYRTLPLAKYLPEFGWEPLVLTPFLLEKPELPFRVIETPYQDALGFWKKIFGFDLDRDIERQVRERFGVTSKKSPIDFILTRGGAVFNYPDAYKGWKPFALKAGNELLQHQEIDAIISCHPVATSHIIASYLKTRYGVPWIADFADLWSQNHNYRYGPIRRRIDTRLERKTLANADTLVTRLAPWAEKLRTLHKGKTVYAISHGFDPAEVNVPPVELTTKFTITFTGSLYAGKQDTSIFLAALRDLFSDKTINPDDVEVRFYGREGGWFAKEVKEYGLSDIVKHHGFIPRQVALEKQRESQLLLQINWEGREGMAGCPLKLFEYLAARRPVLATGGLGNYMTRELLDETKAGVHAPTKEDVKKSLKELYQEYKLKGKVDYKGDTEKINEYSYRETAKKFSEILNHLAGVVAPSEVNVK